MGKIIEILKCFIFECNKIQNQKKQNIHLHIKKENFPFSTKLRTLAFKVNNSKNLNTCYKLKCINLQLYRFISYSIYKVFYKKT